MEICNLFAVYSAKAPGANVRGCCEKCLYETQQEKGSEWQDLCMMKLG